MFPNAFHLFSVTAPESVSKVNTLRRRVGRWGTRRGWRLVFVLLLSLKSAKKGLLTPPLILHAPCQKWLVNMHACLWIAFTSGPVRCECHSWDPAQWFPRTHVHENELLHWYFLVFNVHMCPTPRKVSPHLTECFLATPDLSYRQDMKPEAPCLKRFWLKNFVTIATMFSFALVWNRSNISNV